MITKSHEMWYKGYRFRHVTVFETAPLYVTIRFIYGTLSEPVVEYMDKLVQQGIRLEHFVDIQKYRKISYHEDLTPAISKMHMNAWRTRLKKQGYQKWDFQSSASYAVPKTL